VCLLKILDLLIEVFNKGGDAKLDVCVFAEDSGPVDRSVQ